MPLKAYKIKEISSESTFELSFDSPLWSILGQMGVLKDLGEAGGIIGLDDTSFSVKHIAACGIGSEKCLSLSSLLFLSNDEWSELSRGTLLEQYDDNDDQTWV